MGGPWAYKEGWLHGNGCRMNSAQQQELKRLCPSVRWQVDMAAYSTFRTGGTVEALVEVDDSACLPELLRWLDTEKVPWRVLGGGSNILFTSGQHQGVFIRLQGGMGNIAWQPVHAEPGEPEKQLVDTGAGVSMALFLAWCLCAELGGLEFMVGIPGTVGGAVCMNAGAFGGTISQRLFAVRCLNSRGELLDLPATALDFQYRRTVFPLACTDKYIIVRVSLCMQPDTGEAIKGRMRELLAQRKAKQPVGVASAGSFFKNPLGDYAGRLIEQAGLKGYACGQAVVSPRHGNFLVNRGGASPEDILALMRIVQERVYESSGILLEPEVRIY